MNLTTHDIEDAIIAFAMKHDMPTEQGIFLKRKFAENASWFWAYNALIHWRRCEWQLAVSSWRYAMRLCLRSDPS